jgi:hypothetical protein
METLDASCLQNVALFTPNPPSSPLQIAEKERARLLGKTDAECWRTLRIILSPAPCKRAPLAPVLRGSRAGIITHPVVLILATRRSPGAGRATCSISGGESAERWWWEEVVTVRALRSRHGAQRSPQDTALQLLNVRPLPGESANCRNLSRQPPDACDESRHQPRARDHGRPAEKSYRCWHPTA